MSLVSKLAIPVYDLETMDRGRTLVPQEVLAGDKRDQINGKPVK